MLCPTCAVLANKYLCEPIAGGFVDEQGNLASVESSQRKTSSIRLRDFALVFGLPYCLVR